MLIDRRIAINYEESLNFIHGIPRMAPKPDLSRIRKMLSLMGNPQDSLKFVHVAGTNGKGSACTMLSYILKDAGYKTGLYISPFIIDFRERIQINNDMIEKNEFLALVEYVKTFYDELLKTGEAPSEFEFVFAVAVQYFKDKGCEAVVLETGLGGRLDATNVIKAPLASVIMPVDFDHTEILGDTIEKIAAEKCGIIKKGSKVICYPRQKPEALEVIMRYCADLSCTLVIPRNVKLLSADIYKSCIRYDNMRITIPLGGEHQVYNAITAIEAARNLGLEITAENIINGIEGTKFPSRMEVLIESPTVIIDGAHNAGGAKSIAEGLKLANYKKLYLITAVMQDKDAGLFDSIIPHCDTVITASIPDFPRAAPADALMAVLRDKFPDKIFYSLPDPLDAYCKAMELAGSEDLILICGSLYLAAYLRDKLKNNLDK